MGQHRWVAGVVVVAASLAASPAVARPTGAEPLAAIQAVLDERAAAIRHGDRAAFLATVDPEAPPAFRAAQDRSFTGLTSLPLASYRLEALDRFGDLSPPGLADRYGAPTYLPETRQHLRFDGYDERDATDRQWLTFVVRAGQWFVAADGDLADLGLETAVGLWDLGPVRLRPTEHFLVISRTDHADRADALAAIAEEAMTVLNDRWAEPWHARLPLILPGSVGELERILQTTFDLDNFVAFVGYSVLHDDEWVPGAPRVYIQDRNLRRYGRDVQVEVLVHELVHAATAHLAGPFVDDWVHEALADWVAKGYRTDERAPRASDGRLPRPHQFRTGGGAAIGQAYRESRSAASFLADRWGRDAPLELFGALGAVSVAPGSVDYQVGAALRTVTGLGFTDFEDAWSNW